MFRKLVLITVVLLLAISACTPSTTLTAEPVPPTTESNEDLVEPNPEEPTPYPDVEDEIVEEPIEEPTPYPAPDEVEVQPAQIHILDRKKMSGR